jgi:hypothetical protein
LRSDQRSAARLREVGGVVRIASLAGGGSTSKKRPSPHLHKVTTRSNKASPRTFETAVNFDFLRKRVEIGIQLAEMTFLRRVKGCITSDKINDDRELN